MKRHFGTFLALTICLLLFVYVKFLEKPVKTDHEQTLYVFSGATIDTLNITDGKKELTLEKKEGGWFLKADGKKVAQQKIDLLLSDWAAPTGTPLPEPAHDLAPFGLTNPERSLEVGTTSGLSKTVLIGKSAPVGGNSYAKLKDRDEVYLIPTFKTNLSADPKPWLEPETHPAKK